MAQRQGKRSVLLEEPRQCDGEEVFVPLEPRLPEDSLKPLVFERLDSGSRQRERQEATEITVERAGERVSLEESDGFFHDRTQILLFDEKAPFQAIEEEERISDVGQAVRLDRSRASGGSWHAGPG